MKRAAGPVSAREYVADLAASGRYHFGSTDARVALGVSPAAAKLALNRLEKRKVIASPARGFYVIVPSQYRALGCLPAEQFVPALMERLALPYYAGLLSAAQYHGAAHHRPQEFQACVGTKRRPIQCGAVRVAFFVRKRIKDVAVHSFNTPRGAILVSTPEVTALDLVGYADRVGGLEQVATVLSEIAEKIEPDKLAVAADTAPLPWGQRLGYLLALGGADDDKLQPLKDYLHERVRRTAPLLSGASTKRARRDREWKLYINTRVEAEFV